ncbi:MAG: hypothetical protein LBT26_09370 [Clostridiales Family XIII bacterium]|jgi:dsDNA-specific endonuclease/ATPase MutS2|nr:hypothetical protein [Clostridiales Family XIII bacterium]
MKLATDKTKREIGFSEVLSGIEPLTPFGRRRLAELQPFMPGEEGGLEEALDSLQAISRMLGAQGEAVGRLRRVFGEMKDISYTFERSAGETLSVVELFEVKALMLQMECLGEIFRDMGGDLPENFLLEDVSTLLDVLDPEGNRLPTFYIYDVFSEKLARLRKEKKALERKLRGMEEALRETAQAGMQAEIDGLAAAAEEEELEVQGRLSAQVGAWAPQSLRNCRRIGELDFVMAKGAYASENACTRPQIVQAHILHVEEGRYLPAERLLLREKGRAYSPVDIRLQEGVTCITGANMGGKTISMKLAGLVAMMAQYGLFVPCKAAVVGLSASVHILIGDSQDVQKGLSSFGSEMDGLNKMLAAGGERALLFIDEIAGSTNPAEGRALTKSLIRYLSARACISLITTHFDRVADDGAVRLQVRGLADVNFEQLAAALNGAEAQERVELLARYMDYRLEPVSSERKIPRDAIRIAEILGVDPQIVEGARRILEERDH